jgi:hypothetical protein
LEFIVRILFSGMMTFVPSSDGTQLDVVLLNVGHGHSISDGTGIAHHKPLLITRGGGCSGSCPTSDAAIAAYLFGDKSTSAANDALTSAVSGGGAWDLTGSQVTVEKGSSGAAALPALTLRQNLRNGIIPTTATEREDISWLADLEQICPTCGFDTSVLAAEPSSSLVAARFRLDTGKVYTYSIARVGSSVTPVQFKRVDGSGSTSSYSQAIAAFMAVDIAVTGSSIKLVETKFDGSTGRTMTLTPDSNGRVEIAVLNLPELVPATPNATPGIGKHFQRYYDVTSAPPSAAARLVPHPGAAPGAPSYPSVTWSSIHPADTLWSDLLTALRLNVGRSINEVTLCPPTQP